MVVCTLGIKYITLYNIAPFLTEKLDTDVQQLGIGSIAYTPYNETHQSPERKCENESFELEK